MNGLPGGAAALKPWKVIELVMSTVYFIYKSELAI
jgi:hypothetical protein